MGLSANIVGFSLLLFIYFFIFFQICSCMQSCFFMFYIITGVVNCHLVQLRSITNKIVSCDTFQIEQPKICSIGLDQYEIDPNLYSFSPSILLGPQFNNICIMIGELLLSFEFRFFSLPFTSEYIQIMVRIVA